MSSIAKKFVLAAVAAVAMTVLGPFSGEAAAAGGCAQKKAQGLACGGHPDKGGGRVDYRQLELEEGKTLGTSLSRCTWQNAKRYIAAGRNEERTKWVRCPNMSLEETKGWAMAVGG